VSDGDSSMTGQPLVFSQQGGRSVEPQSPQPFEEQHYPISYWARRWGFSEKTVRGW
jgi:hypothetical protein